MRWTADQYQEYLVRKAVPVRSPANEGAHFALGRMPAGVMNKTESAYADHLEQLRQAGEILWYKFEGIKLRLADNTFLTVDFPVLPKSGFLEMRDVKGGWIQEDAKVKMKVAASIYPFRFMVVRRRKDGWDHQLIGRD